MISSPRKPRFEPGIRVCVTQRVRIGDVSWQTQLVGTVEGEGSRPVGGMEMGGKASYCHQTTLTLKRDSGELTVVALDENSEVQVVS